MKGYNPFKLTAITRRGLLSKPMDKLLTTGRLRAGMTVLDIGCGKGEDVQLLRNNHNINIVGYDKFNEAYRDINLLNRRYDVVTCNYCFNVIPELHEHEELLNTISRLGREVYISVRADIKAIKDTWEYIDEYDCWKTSKGSYQRFYNEDRMVEDYFGKVEYIINDSSTKLFKLI